MSIPVRLKQELKTLNLVFLYFACWLGVLLLVKQLVLAEYHIRFAGISSALIGARSLAIVFFLLRGYGVVAVAMIGLLCNTAGYLLRYLSFRRLFGPIAYGRRFIDSLPPARLVLKPLDQVVDRVANLRPDL